FSRRRDRAPGPCPPQGRVAPSERTGLETSVLLRSALPAAGPAAASKPNRLRGRIVHERRAHRQYPRASLLASRCLPFDLSPPQRSVGGVLERHRHNLARAADTTMAPEL